MLGLLQIPSLLLRCVMLCLRNDILYPRFCFISSSCQLNVFFYLLLLEIIHVVWELLSEESHGLSCLVISQLMLVSENIQSFSEFLDPREIKQILSFTCKSS